MRLRMFLPAVMIGAGLLLPSATPALAKTSYKQHKNKKYKVSRKFKASKVKRVKPSKARRPAVKRPRSV